MRVLRPPAGGASSGPAGGGGRGVARLREQAGVWAPGAWERRGLSVSVTVRGRRDPRPRGSGRPAASHPWNWVGGNPAVT